MVCLIAYYDQCGAHVHEYQLVMIGELPYTAYNIVNPVQLILDLAISPDANVLATAGRDRHVKFWSISSSNSDQHV